MAKSELAVGIDLGGTNMSVGVVDRKGKLLGRAKKKTKASEGRDTVVARLVSAMEEACADAKVELRQVNVVGIGAPGPVDYDAGVVLTAGNLGWKNVLLAELLSKQTGIHTVVDNDANVAAWGEATVGAGEGRPSMLAVWVGTGVGCGLVLGGQLWRGDLHTAGELGQTILFPNGPIGGSTLEESCSRTGMVRSITTRLGFYPDSHFHKVLARQAAEGKGGPVGSGGLAEAYEAEDELTRQVVHASAELLGLAIANCITLLSVRTVVLGGGVTEALGRSYTERVEKALRTNVFPSAISGKVEVRMTKLKDDAGVLGAAMLGWSAVSAD